MHGRHPALCMCCSRRSWDAVEISCITVRSMHKNRCCRSSTQWFNRWGGAVCR